jgi:hypothetical protein
MRLLFAILLFASCTNKISDEDMVSAYLERDTILIKSQENIENISEVLPKIDTIIIKEEKRIDNNLKSLKFELQEAKATQNRTKLIYIHDTIMIKEKTNFWGKKRISKDSMQSIDSTEYL